MPHCVPSKKLMSALQFSQTQFCAKPWIRNPSFANKDRTYTAGNLAAPKLKSTGGAFDQAKRHLFLFSGSCCIQVDVFNPRLPLRKPCEIRELPPCRLCTSGRPCIDFIITGTQRIAMEAQHPRLFRGDARKRPRPARHQPPGTRGNESPESKSLPIGKNSQRNGVGFAMAHGRDVHCNFDMKKVMPIHALMPLQVRKARIWVVTRQILGKSVQLFQFRDGIRL